MSSKKSSTEYLTTDEILERLRTAVGPKGDFPVSAKIVHEILGLVSNENAHAEHLSAIIKKDPTLSARVINVVNSAFYDRGARISNVSQAVMKMGLTALSQLCGSLVVLQKFVPLARKKGPFAQSLASSILVSIINTKLHQAYAEEHKKKSDSDHLLGTVCKLGELLFAFYFPQIILTAQERAKLKQISVQQSIQEITGISGLRMTVEVINALSLPEAYVDILNKAEELKTNWSFETTETNITNWTATVLSVSSIITEALAESRDEDAFVKVLESISPFLKISEEKLVSVLRTLSHDLHEYCKSLDLPSVELPEYLDNLCTEMISKKSIVSDTHKAKPYLSELKAAIVANEAFSEIIVTALEALHHGLDFDRALYFQSEGKQLKTKLAIGEFNNIDPYTFVKPSNGDSNSVEVQCFIKKLIVTTGTGLFEDSWPLVVLPVGSSAKNCKGVIYADKFEGKEEIIASQDHAIISIITELLNKATEQLN
jgi:HD-like signal output (HDOD) protein